MCSCCVLESGALRGRQVILTLYLIKLVRYLVKLVRYLVKLVREVIPNSVGKDRVVTKEQKSSAASLYFFLAFSFDVV